MEAGDPVITKLLPLLDVIVDGEYKEECRNLRLPFRGSENQRILDVPLSFKGKMWYNFTYIRGFGSKKGYRFENKNKSVRE